MRLLLRPEIQRFVDEQVKSGNFSRPEDVVEAALDEMRVAAETELDDETIAAIHEAEAQGDRGEGIELNEVRAHMKRRIGR